MPMFINKKLPRIIHWLGSGLPTPRPQPNSKPRRWGIGGTPLVFNRLGVMNMYIYIYHIYIYISYIYIHNIYIYTYSYIYIYIYIIGIFSKSNSLNIDWIITEQKIWWQVARFVGSTHGLGKCTVIFYHLKINWYVVLSAPKTFLRRHISRKIRNPANKTTVTAWNHSTNQYLTETDISTYPFIPLISLVLFQTRLWDISHEITLYLSIYIYIWLVVWTILKHIKVNGKDYPIYYEK